MGGGYMIWKPQNVLVVASAKSENGKFTFDDLCLNEEEDILDMTSDKNRIEYIFKAIIESHFSYCPLISVFFSRKSNGLINIVCEMYLLPISADKQSRLEEPLWNNVVRTHHKRNVQVPMTEICETVNGCAPLIVETVFVFLWKQAQFKMLPPTNCLSVLDLFVGLALKGLRNFQEYCPMLNTNKMTVRNILT